MLVKLHITHNTLDLWWVTVAAGWQFWHLVLIWNSDSTNKLSKITAITTDKQSKCRPHSHVLSAIPGFRFWITSFLSAFVVLLIVYVYVSYTCILSCPDLYSLLTITIYDTATVYCILIWVTISKLVPQRYLTTIIYHLSIYI